ncbi:UDP-3-O-(3-hydroxymyristoyl)glucosamine N-acyltransferase [bacterium (Candidatus Blackallbacteria) CG17_big_fil_post_rev_8_21_14_2_50_48_46]|uniref:UDP-3-O-acylglucosamine N-acyltransferase n=1 Tax=bacterium (Candidatus Blackallbacteria) CG17_big_fil_post_rev_8_21_14_2_50_48_46 TaxID=2014261 RepID=A0A2M7G546_9BACT|nr:MAG: UDP-3-O-(3-hydroxymyristoyl)glucosamine N-acyltransferase [bacterium (Candidatus Blackallbacteria) CG18_big_fil_WC_8_21_14_2_50_49_26]PIW17031.1 MAG: UDP-3-O-(3-hydroxymyristoyl)glucosamine N-acyltransferase [bacterium (Candidatus Blackallbacteria) CG17_big_fil_post_rev_8_21_14_2_50_48_46]PIW48161.1 MAG: UDP-3-O-(3-hydroxymyristoyl)glucosamine N-acyltransferase [bacterium (Candidatus Blackallbacteria) CG13_big_fil_rev_8_21_14_2_50_49_14]
MPHRLDVLARLTGADLAGDPSWEIARISTPEEALREDLVFLLDARWAEAVQASAAQTVLLSPELKTEDLKDKYCLIVPEVREALASLLAFFHAPAPPQPGIHPTAILGKACKIAPSAQIGPYCVLGDSVEIGENTVLSAHVSLGSQVRIGAQCRLYPQVTLYDQVSLGDQVIIHSGSVIGSDGYGFYFKDGQHHKIPQTGGVEIGDRVEIGAQVSIDRGTVGQTRIGTGTKIDNLVQIGHNVQIGRHCLLVAQVGISGSTVLGDFVTLAGQTGVAGHLEIGSGVIAAGKSGITQDIPAGLKISGFPAQEHRQELKQQALLRRLPELFKRLRNLNAQ